MRRCSVLSKDTSILVDQDAGTHVRNVLPFVPEIHSCAVEVRSGICYEDITIIPNRVSLCASLALIHDLDVSQTSQSWRMHGSVTIDLVDGRADTVV